MITANLIQCEQLTLLKIIRYQNFLVFILLLLFPISASQSEFDDTHTPQSARHTSKRLKKTPLDDVKGMLEEAKAPITKKQSIYATEEDVELIRGKLPRNQKALPDNYFWKIFFQQKSAGKIFIDLVDFPPLGRQPLIQIFLNKKTQGKHIGRIAYERACRLSHFDVVYASMRRNNIASYKSAHAAGFKEIKNGSFKQNVLKWVRIIK